MATWRTSNVVELPGGREPTCTYLAYRACLYLNPSRKACELAQLAGAPRPAFSRHREARPRHTVSCCEKTWPPRGHPQSGISGLRFRNLALRRGDRTHRRGRLGSREKLGARSLFPRPQTSAASCYLSFRRQPRTKTGHCRHPHPRAEAGVASRYRASWQLHPWQMVTAEQKT